MQTLNACLDASMIDADEASCGKLYKQVRRKTATPGWYR